MTIDFKRNINQNMKADIIEKKIKSKLEKFVYDHSF